jgi:LuxR family maltose regulon positive regulatory protein
MDGGDRVEQPSRAARSSPRSQCKYATPDTLCSDTPCPDTVALRATVDRHLVATRRAVADDTIPAALEELEAALGAAAQQDLRQPFLAAGPPMNDLLSARVELGTVDPAFAADLLSRMAVHAPQPRPSSRAIQVPLTARELNILGYLATTLSTKEIAQTLYVSINTVKTHQRSIHQKLGASDRRQAVARARTLGLL